MKISNEFNVSNNNPEMQKKQDYERHQDDIQRKRITADVSRIQDSKDQRHANTLINHRNNLMDTRRDMQEEFTQNEIARELERDKAGRPTHEMPSPYGTTAQSHKAKEKQSIHTQITTDCHVTPFLAMTPLPASPAPSCFPREGGGLPPNLKK